MQKNIAQKWVVFAFEDEGGTNPGEPVTGDAANITANLYQDGSATPDAVNDTNPTELGGGYYVFDITAAECNYDHIVIVPTSTGNTNVIGVPGAVWTTPAYFSDMQLTVAGRVDVGEWLGSTVATVTQNGVPEVDVTHWKGTSVADPTTGGFVKSDVTAIDENQTSATRLQQSTLGIIAGTAQTGTLSTTVMTSDLTGYLDDTLPGRAIVWTSGDASGQASTVTDYASSNGTLTYDAITTAPANGDTFVLV